MPNLSEVSQKICEYTPNERIRKFILDAFVQCKPSAIHFCDGSEEENDHILNKLVLSGTAKKLNPALRSNSYLCTSTVSDTARVESATYICTPTREEAGPTNNWIEPTEVMTELDKRFEGSMIGRTMYVIPFSMAPIESPFAMYGIQLSDSEYVVVNMKIMTRMGAKVTEKLQTAEKFTLCLHSVGAPLQKGQQDTTWPCNPNDKWIVHLPQSMLIYSYGSGYGGNALLSKKCTALRIASYVAKQEGNWLAEHMYIIELTSPKGEVKYICGAYPSGCGKTNAAMLIPAKIPSEDGEWKVKCLGDDIAWLRKGQDGRLYALNPENGFFGISIFDAKTNPNIMATIKENTIFTNVAMTHDGDVYWDGMHGKKEPKSVISWLRREWFGNGLLEGNIHPTKPGVNGNTFGRIVDRMQQGPAAHPNARFTVSASQCPIISEKFEEPLGVPISAIIFGGRRDDTIPLVYQAYDWEHGTFVGATLSSQTTAAAVGATGVLRNDPMSMKPFIGYSACDYFQHWVDVGKMVGEDKLPKIFHINVFRKNKQGEFLFPGFGENIRIFKWIFDRCDDNAPATPHPLGYFPTPGSVCLDGLTVKEEDLFTVSQEELNREVALHEDFFEKMGDMPDSMKNQLDLFKKRVQDHQNGAQMQSPKSPIPSRM